MYLDIRGESMLPAIFLAAMASGLRIVCFVDSSSVLMRSALNRLTANLSDVQIFQPEATRISDEGVQFNILEWASIPPSLLILRPDRETVFQKYVSERYMRVGLKPLQAQIVFSDEVPRSAFEVVFPVIEFR